MKKKSNVSFGPGAASLILIFVVLALSVLGMLSLLNAQNDLKLSKRSVNVTESVYQLYETAERDRAVLDGLLYSLASSTENDEEYLNALGIILSLDTGDQKGEAFKSVFALLESAANGAGDREEYKLVLDALIAMGASSESYDEFAEAIDVIGRMELDGRQVSWTESDALRTLELSVEISELGSANRSDWSKHKLYSHTDEGNDMIEVW